ncbi:MAG: class I SAM-dependent methyltransferase [Solirubrobacterales bacterium]
MSAPGRSEPPLPPRDLMSRVGHVPDDKLEFVYLLSGQDLKSKVCELLGDEWSWEGSRVLDFGCGSGRLLRQLLDEARVAEIHGSDISEEMVSWIRANLCPPIAGATVNGERPPLAFPDDHFDLITAISVFTHIADRWSDWLLEMKRVLKPGGTLIATFLDSSCAGALAPLPWDEERVGMSAFGYANPDYSWVNVLHSRWWLREHWGRAFEILKLLPGDEVLHGDGVAGPRQGWLLLRARDVELSPADLERERPDDDRYLAARRYQLELLRAEGDELRSRNLARLLRGSVRIRTRLNRTRETLRHPSSLFRGLR